MLGPVEVWRDGHRLVVGSRRARLVLGLLLLNGGRLTSAEALIDGLWPQSPPPSARAQLHNMIGHLRRTLAESGRELLVTRPGGYELRLDDSTLDLHEFRRLVGSATQATAGSDHLAAVTAAAEALDTWRGPAFADLDAGLVRDQRAALHEERLAATEVLLGAELALGRFDDMRERLPDLIAEAPYRERLHEFHLLALHGTGRSAEALAVYHRTRERFVDELGIEPGPELRAVAERLANGDDRAPAGQRAPRQLPSVTPVLTGRTAMVDEITTALRTTAGAAVLVGPGGAGKTTVAVAAAHGLLAAYPDGQLYAELRGSRPNPADPQAVLARFVRALAPDGTTVPVDAAQRVAAYRDLLAGRRVLVVLDDAADEDQVRTLLPDTPGCAAVVTSRQRLGGLPNATGWSVPMLAPDDSVRLLTRLVGAERVHREPAAAADIAALCGHSPLGVCIAGARLGMHRDLPLADFRDRLAARSQRLDELAVGDLNVRTTIALSYEGLDPGARRLFRRLGLVTAPDWPEWVAGEPVGPLVDNHLVEALGVDAAGQRRYRLHDLVADFARERLADEETEEDRRATVAATLDTWLALATDADLRTPHGAEYAEGLPAAPPPHRVADPQTWFEVERASLVAAVEEACRLGDAATAAALALRTAGYYGVRAFDDDRTHMLMHAAACVREHGSDELLVRVLNALFATLLQQSRYLDLAAVDVEQLAVARRLGDPEWELRALYGSGFLARSSGRLREAALLHDEAIGLARRRTGVATQALTNNLIGLADVHAEAGEPERGLPLFEEVLEIEREDRHSRQRAVLLHAYGMALVDAGRLDEATEVLTSGVEVARALGDDFGVATLSQKLADADLRAGRLTEAAERLAECLRAHEAMDNREGVAWTLRSQSDLAAVERRWPDAVTASTRALEILLPIGEPLEIARTLDRLARALDEVGEPRRAAAHRAECAAILADRGLGEECLDHPPRIPRG